MSSEHSPTPYEIARQIMRLELGTDECEAMIESHVEARTKALQTENEKLVEALKVADEFILRSVVDSWGRNDMRKTIAQALKSAGVE